MTRGLVLLLLGCSAIVTGCSPYPLPQDITGVTTSNIVDNIRCEAREGLHQTILDALRSKSYAGKRIWKNYYGEQLAEKLDREPELWNSIQFEQLNPEIKSTFAFYRNSQIAYQFTLTLEEQNIDSSGAGFTQNFLGASKRISTLGLSSAATRTRNMARNFFVVDTFEELALKVAHKYCKEKRPYDIIYPIRGKLPIKDLISSYVDINNFRNLAGNSDDPRKVFGTSATPAVPQMGDTITFTTKLSATINPTLTVSPPGLGLLLTSANFKTEDYRQDMHKVVIVVSTSPDAAKIDPLDATVAPPLPPEFGVVPNTVQRLPVIKPIKNGKLTETRAEFARQTIDNQLRTNFLNDISSIAEGFRRNQ